MQQLAAQSLPVSDPVANRTGEILPTLQDRPAALFNRLAGASVAAPTDAQCRSVGEFRARIHLAGRDYPRPQVNPRGLDWWREVVPVVDPLVSDKQRTLLASELAFQQALTGSERYGQLPKGPVHADLFCDIALFDAGRLTGVLDFYFAGCDALLFDIAVCLNDWCVDPATGRPQNALTAAFLGGYESVRKLLSCERSMLPEMQRAGAFRFWLSRLWDKHLPREAKLLTAHDPDHFERLLRGLRERETTPWPPEYTQL